MERTAVRKLKQLFRYSLVPPTALVVAVVLFDPYQVMRPLFGMRNFLINLAYGIPSFGLLWLKSWLTLIAFALVIYGLLFCVDRRPDAARLMFGLAVGALLGVLLALVLDEPLLGWRQIPLGIAVPIAYAAAGAAIVGTLVSLRFRPRE